MPLPPIFRRTRSVGFAAVVAFIVVHLVVKAVVFSHPFLTYVADPVYDATRGLVTHSTIAGIFEISIVGAFLFAIVRLRRSDLGIHSGISNAVLVTIFVWSMAQFLAVFVGRLDGGTLFFGKAWRVADPFYWAGLVQSQAVTAFIEELMFRGFLLPQVFLILIGVTKWTWIRCVVVAALVTQTYFALCHVPSALRMGLSNAAIAVYVVEALLVGLLFVAIYLRTGNLFVAIGIHGLLNYPGSLFVSRVDPSLIVLVLSCALLIAWPYCARIMNEVFTLRVGMIEPSLSSRQFGLLQQSMK